MSINVLHLRSSAGFYGAERVILTLMNRSSEAGINAKLACIENYITGDRELYDIASASNLSVKEIKCKGKLDLKTIFRIANYCRSENIDIIHTHDYKGIFYGLLAGKLSSAKVVSTLHGWTSNETKQRIYHWIERLLLNRVDHITVVSDQILKTLKEFGIKQNIRFIPNGVDEINFSPMTQGFGKQRWMFTDKNYVFGTIARMSSEKGHENLVKAFKRVVEENEQAKLLLVGDGELRSDLEKLSTDLQLQDSISFVGSQSEIERILNDIDCYVSPSLTEGMPMSILEAMATGLAIVATNVGSIGEMLSSGSGKVVAANNISELADSMIFMMRNKDVAETMSVNARSRVEEKYSSSQQIKSFKNVYRTALYE